MEEVQFKASEENGKTPTFLVVLVVLSFIKIGIHFFVTISGLFKGKLNSSEIDLLKETFYVEMDKANVGSQPGLLEFMQTYLDAVIYENTDGFFSMMIFTIIALILGGVGAFFMLKLRKLGFHLYVIYSLLSVGIYYLVFPMELIQTPFVILSLIASSVMVLLYGLNLKHMK